MDRGPTRLLVALKPRASVDEAISEVLPGTSWTYLASATPSQLLDGEVLLVGSVERELGAFDPASVPHLAFVQRLYTGLDGFPFGRFPSPVVVAGNVGGFAPFVAEHAVALALAAARAIPRAHAQVVAGHLRPVPPATSLRGRTAVILGFGAIGREIAHRLDGFGMRRVGVNRTGRAAPGVEQVYAADELPTALGEGDVVFEARPLTRATAGSLGAAEFARMPEDAIFVNVGRAGTVVEADLFQHVRDHPGFRAALDVWPEEDYGAGTLTLRFPWATLPNFVGTPHSAAILPEAEAYGLRHALRNVGRFLAGQPPEHVADRRDYVE